MRRNRPASRPARALAAVAAVLMVSTTVVGVTTSAPAAAKAPGPALKAKKAQLRKAVRCTKNIGRTPGKPAVLLVHGTGATPKENFSWNYYDKFTKRGYAYCTVTIPDRGMGDMQGNVEYVVHAIRHAYRRSGKNRIAVIGHSQGGFLPSYALRVWPDLTKKVDDFISYAGTFTYGTALGVPMCLLPCAEAFQQFTPGSDLLTEIAKRPLPATTSYTSFGTRLDEIVAPQPKASRIKARGARNYLLQDLCPTDVAEHLTIIAERPFFQLAFDALTHRGPGRLSRIKKLRCGFDQQVLDAAPVLPTFGLGLAGTYQKHLSTREPRLRGYWKS